MDVVRVPIHLTKNCELSKEALVAAVLRLDKAVEGGASSQELQSINNDLRHAVRTYKFHMSSLSTPLDTSH